MKMNVNKLRGIIPPVITPLQSTSELDVDGTKKLVNHILAGGVHGLFLLGTTGEGPSIDFVLKKEFITLVSEEVDDRVPIIVGISDTSFNESIKIAEHSCEKGAVAVVATPPYYFPAGQAELIEYMTHLVKKLPLPLFVYNMPAMTKINIEPETVRELSKIDGICGLKDSSGNMIYYHEILDMMRDRSDFTVLIGPEEMLAESVIFGGDGGISGGANIFPQLYVDMYEAAVRQDIPTILELQKKIFILRNIYSCGQFSSSMIKGVKCALHCMGICSDFMAEPFRSFSEKQEKEIRAILKILELIP
jgi:4-hydroxy-tetrahydrodipicolinate synthase